MKGGHAASLSWCLALSAVALDFTVSGNLLTDVGIAYIRDGGYPIEKLHPGSYAAILAGLLKLSGRTWGAPSMRRLWTTDRLVRIFIGGMSVCAIYTCVTTGTGNVIVFLDTFLSAGMLAVALQDMTVGQQQRLSGLLQCLIALNAFIAIMEAMTEWHVISIPAPGAELDKEFRPTALYDHALTGAAATMLGLWLPGSRVMTGYKRLGYLGLILCALLAFGERTPLAAALLTLAMCSAVRSFRKLLLRDLRLRDLATCAAVPLCAIALAGAASSHDFGARLGAHLYWDDSAQVRLNQFGIFNLLSPQQFVFGCARKDLLALIEPLRLSFRVAVIENFWLFTLVVLGILFFPVFLVSFTAFLKWLWRKGDVHGRLMIVTFVIVASSSNSLGRKSTLLITLVACVLAASPTFDRTARRLHTGLT